MKRNRLNKSIGVLIIVFIVINFIPTSYYVMSPGIAQNLSPIITVENGYKDKIAGSFMLTAVGSQKATVWDYIYINLLSPDGYELELLSEQLPEGIDMQKYLGMMSDLMKESQLTAEAVALKKVGYDVQVDGDGVEIVEIIEESEAYNVLQNGDIIVAVDGQETKIASEAVDYIKRREIGDQVSLTVIRDNKKLNFDIKTIELPESPNKPSIGIFITTKNLSYDFPIEVKYDTGEIVGPSAGGMFALEIYNQLIEKDLTYSKKIAGTGTINLNGEIGEIDGIKQKIIAAEEVGAEIFLVPDGNYEDAKRVDANLELVPIGTFDQAIDYLNSLEVKDAA